MDEIKKHTDEDSCWLVVYDKVYDVADFLYDHPGGPPVLLNIAGKDGTKQFEEQKHDWGHLAIMEEFIVGEFEGGKESPWDK